MSTRVRYLGDEVKAALRAKGVRGLFLGSEHLLEESNRTAPIEENTLIESGATDVDEANLTASVYYDTPYARRQHEELEWEHDPGRRAKWLELTAKERKPAIEQILADALGDH
jgi:hypothetical protein